MRTWSVLFGFATRPDLPASSQNNGVQFNPMQLTVPSASDC